MSQVTIYLDPETVARLDAAARSVGLSRSRWVAEVIREKTAREWPESVRRALGSWPDAPTAEEIREGTGEVGTLRSASPERRRQQLLDLVGPMRVLPFDEPEASVAARIRVELERAGEPIGPMDTLIAASALRQGATLVTHDVGEFTRVAGLTVEDWY